MASARTILLNIVGNDRVSRTMRNVSRSMANASDETSRLNKAMAGLDKVGKSGGMATAAAGALALTNAVAPAVAAMAALPAAMAAAKVASGTLKVGLAGVGDAMSAVADGDAQALNDSLKKLSPTARAFVKQAASMRREVVGLQQSVQNRLFRGLDGDLKRLGANLLPTARKGMVGVAGALNGIGREAAKTASTPWFRGQVAKVFAGTTGILRTLQGAVRPVLESVLRLVVMGMPLVRQFAAWAVQGIRVAAAWLKMKVESGAAAATIQGIIGVLATLGTIGGNVARTIMNMAGQTRAMGDAGGNFLTTLTQITAKMAAWSASTQGQQTTANLFRTLGQSASQVATVLPLLLSPLGWIVKAIAGLPAPLQTVVGKMLGWAIIISVVSNRLKLLTTITTLHAAATRGATAAMAGYRAVAGTAALGGLIAGFRNVNLAMAANATLATRLGAALKSQLMLWRQMAAAQGISTARLLLHAAAQRIVAAATAVWTGAQWLLNAALNANPIGLIVLALVALGAAVVIAWKKSETFRNIVLGAWNAIKAGVVVAINFVRDHWKLIGAILLGPLGPAFLIITTFWRQIWGAAQIAWRFLQPILGAISGFLRGAFSVAFLVAKNAVKIAWIGIQIYIKVAWLAIRTYFQAIKFYVTEVLAPIFKWLYSNVVRPVFGAIVANIKANWAAAKVIFGALRNFLAAVLGPAFRAFKAVASAAWGGLKTSLSSTYNGGIKPVFNALKSALGTVRSAFSTAVSAIRKIWSGLQSAAKTPVNFVIGIYNRGIVDMVNKLAGFAGVKTRLSKIPQLARGGTLDSPAPVRPMMTNGPLAIVGEGRKAYPEFVIPTDPRYRSRAQALWSMAGQKVMGEKPDNRWLRGPNSLNGEGIGFAQGGSLQTLAFGGIIGDFVKGVKNFTIGNVSKGAETLLSKVLGGSVPGSGTFRDVVAAVPGWIKKTVLEWVKKRVASFGGGPSMERALAWAKTQSGLPYQWGGNGNPSWDCSGFMSAIESVIRGQKPHRRWATSSFNGGTPSGWQRNARSGFMIGVLDNGNAHASHTAGTLLGHNVESSGSAGVRVDGAARGFRDGMFPARYGLKLARGGVVGGLRTATYDSGGLLQPGYTLAYNGTGRPEPVVALARGGTIGSGRSTSKTTSRAARSSAGSTLLKGLTGAVIGDAGKLASWFAKLITEIKKAFAGGTERKLLAWSSSIQKAMSTAASKASAISSQINAAKDYAASVTQSAKEFASLSNLPTRGTGAQVAAGLAERASQITGFASQLTQLRKRGLSGGLLSQVAGMGVGDGTLLARTLLASDASTLKKMNAAQATIDKASVGLGQSAANALYDAGAGAGKGFLSGLVAQRAALDKEMDRLGRKLAGGVGRSFGVKPKVIAAQAVKYDSGGMLPPGLTLAYNATGKPEPVMTSGQYAAATSGRNGGPLVHIDRVEVTERADVDLLASRIGFAARAAAF